MAGSPLGPPLYMGGPIATGKKELNKNVKEGKGGSTGTPLDIKGAGKDTKGEKSNANTLDQNRVNNARNQASAHNVTAKLTLMGYPGLKAKEGLTILNVGSVASGQWYVKDVHHHWDVMKGYITTANLLRSEVDAKSGGGGKGGGKGGGDVGGAVQAGSDNIGLPNKSGPAPVVHGDIRKSGKNATATIRDLDAASQATFTYGDGDWVIDFQWTIASQKKSGANQGANAKSVNQDAKKISTAVNAGSQNIGVK